MRGNARKSEQKAKTMTALILLASESNSLDVYGLSALFVSVMALWITYTESRRNNSAIVKIIECASSLSASLYESNGMPFYKFVIAFRNKGICLNDVHVVLEFRDANGTGWLQSRIPNDDESAMGQADFARGMIGKFAYKSHRMKRFDTEFLLHLIDAKKQNARISIYSQGYLAASFRVGGLCNAIKHAWNRFAFAVNSKLTRKVGKAPEGHDIVRGYTVLPSFVLVEDKIMGFIGNLRTKANETKQNTLEADHNSLSAE